MGLLGRWTGARLTVTLTGVSAVLSIATGIANIGAGRTGPLSPYVPEAVQQTAGFTGTMTGFLLLLSAYALRRRRRGALYSALLLLPLTAIQGVIQSSLYSYPLVVVSVVALPGLLLNRKRFDRKFSLSTSQLAAGLILASVQVYGTVGAYALRDEFPAIREGSAGLVDAFYYTIVTASTVGYGDVTPGPTSTQGKLFGLSVVVLGVVSFTVALGTLLAPLLEARFQRALGRMTETQLDLLEDHVIVLGYGDLTEPILNELTDVGVPFVVIVPDQARAAELSDRGMNVITADPSDEDPLRRAQLADATAVVTATNNDAEDALAVLTARQLRPDVRIVAAATDRENVKKLKRAGADTVISPAAIGGHLLVESALGRADTEDVAGKILGDEGTEDGER
ncbi:NAD-binding protein [Haloarchaeobius salinus]|uniref:NAD-binding protein n=1 Tax=Haloarchaeobius salinus TaxID=1198298 RepID=UPI00210D0919|nr:NAD-binding protein [Haloarchaeobius salinus]